MNAQMRAMDERLVAESLEALRWEVMEQQAAIRLADVCADAIEAMKVAQAMKLAYRFARRRRP